MTTLNDQVQQVASALDTHTHALGYGLPVVVLANPVTANGRITAKVVGATASQMLNPVPGFIGNATVLTGTGDQVTTDFAMTGLPATSYLASVELEFVCSNTLAVAYVVQQAAGGVTLRLHVVNFGAGVTNYASGVLGTTHGVANQMSYNISNTGGGTWTLKVSGLAYWEPT